MRFLIILISALLMTGCATVDQSRFSPGARLMIGTKLSSPDEMQKLTEKEGRTKELADTNGTAPTAKLVIGSGVVDSTAIYASTGAWLNPKSFMSAPLLGSALIDTITGKGMAYHKWTYTYFFNISGTCDKRSCINEGFERFFRRMMDLYLESGHPGTTVENAKARYSGAGAMLNFIEGKMAATINGRQVNDMSLLLVRDLDRLGQYENMKVWGNASPGDFQDRIGFPGLDVEQTSQLLLEASKTSPEIFIFRGVDLRSLQKKEPCRGGYFINNGRKLAVPELGCEGAASN